MSLSLSIKSHDAAAIVRSLLELPPVWGERQRFIFRAAARQPADAFTGAVAAWHAAADTADVLYVRSHALVLMARGALHCWMAQRSARLWSTPPELSTADMSSALSAFAAAAACPVLCRTAFRFLPHLYPLAPEKWATVFGNLSGTEQAKVATALAQAVRKHKFAATALFDAWLTSNPRAAAAFLHCASTPAATAFLATAPPVAVLRAVRWGALWRAHPSLGNAAFDAMELVGNPDEPAVADAALRLHRQPPRPCKVRTRQVTAAEHVRLLFHGTPFTLALQPAKTLREWVRVTDIAQRVGVGLGDFFWAPPTCLEGAQRVEFVRHFTRLYSPIAAHSAKLGHLLTTVAGWTNPEALKAMLAMVTKLLTTEPNTLHNFWACPAFPRAPTECALAAYAECCMEALTFFKAHCGDGATCDTTVLATMLEACMAHPHSPHTAAVVEVLCRMLTAPAGEWLVCNVAGLHTRTAFIESVARHLDRLRVSPAVHAMLSQFAPYGLYYNASGVPLPCPDMPLVVRANAAQKLHAFVAGTSIQRRLFMEKHHLMFPGDFGAALLDTVQHCHCTAALLAAALRFTSRLGAEEWVAVMAPVLVRTPMRCAADIAGAVSAHVPHLGNRVQWALPLLEQGHPLCAALSGRFDAACLPVGARPPNHPVWPYTPADLRRHADPDAAIPDADLWGERWPEYAAALLDAFVAQGDPESFPPNWLARLDHATLAPAPWRDMGEAAVRALHKHASRGKVVADLPPVPWARLPHMPVDTVRQQLAARTPPPPHQRLDDCLPLPAGGVRQRMVAVADLMGLMHVDPERARRALVQALETTTHPQVRCCALRALVEDARMGVWQLADAGVALTPTDKLFLAQAYTGVVLEVGVFEFEVAEALPTWLARDAAAFDTFLADAARGAVVTPLSLLQCVWALSTNAAAHRQAAMKTAKAVMRLEHLGHGVEGLGREHDLWQPVYDALEEALAKFVDVHRGWPVEPATVRFVMDAVAELVPHKATNKPHYKSALGLLEGITFVRHLQRSGVTKPKATRGGMWGTTGSVWP